MAIESTNERNQLKYPTIFVVHGLISGPTNFLSFLHNLFSKCNNGFPNNFERAAGFQLTASNEHTFLRFWAPNGNFGKDPKNQRKVRVELEKDVEVPRSQTSKPRGEKGTRATLLLENSTKVRKQKNSVVKCSKKQILMRNFGTVLLKTPLAVRLDSDRDSQEVTYLT